MLGDGGLGRKLPAVFVVEGESERTLLLGNLEHSVQSQKHRIFVNLKLAGLNVGVPDLYQFR